MLSLVDVIRFGLEYRVLASARPEASDIHIRRESKCLDGQ